jgi:hypothetical protein
MQAVRGLRFSSVDREDIRTYFSSVIHRNNHLQTNHLCRTFKKMHESQRSLRCSFGNKLDKLLRNQYNNILPKRVNIRFRLLSIRISEGTHSNCVLDYRSQVPLSKTPIKISSKPAVDFHAYFEMFCNDDWF